MDKFLCMGDDEKKGEKSPVGNRYRKLPIEIEAHRWFKNGDHPLDGTERFTGGEFKCELIEGKVVRYYRAPLVPGTDLCSICIKPMHDHGWIDTLEGGHIVCPGDWIVTGVQGEHYPIKDSIFKETYEEA